MADRCELCDGPLQADPSFYGPHFCGLCLAISFERKHIWIEKLTDLIKQIFLQIADPAEIQIFLKQHPLGTHEIALSLWNWYEEKYDTVSFNNIRSLNLQDLIDGVNFIVEISLFLPLNEILSKETGERAVATFLDENQHLLRAATGYYHQGDSGHCLKEFKFGTEYVADFVIVNLRRSLPPIIKLVELEPIADNVFTQKGLPTQRLQTAHMQVKQWQNWIRLHRDGFVSELRKRLRNAVDPTSLYTWIYEKEATIESYIFIGRRQHIEGNDQRHILMTGEGNLTIHTYDTMLDLARDFDADHIEQLQEIETKQFIKKLRTEGYKPKDNVGDMLNAISLTSDENG